MIARILLFASLLPLSALAQLQVFEFDGTTDTAVGSLVNVGAVAPGDTLETRFHVRNVGAGPATLSTLALAGDGFLIVSAPSLPYILAPYVGPASEAEFDIDFSPTTTGSFSAFVAVNSISIALQGNSVVIGLLDARRQPDSAHRGRHRRIWTGGRWGQSNTRFRAVEFGQHQRHGRQRRRFPGNGFSGPIGLTTPVQIGSGQSVPFQVTFTPQSGTAYQGTLTVDGRTFTLTGQGLDPRTAQRLHRLRLHCGRQRATEQHHHSAGLGLASQRRRHARPWYFSPASAGVTDDAAVQFLSGPLRIATVTIAMGATSALIGGQSSMAFQTGTTAGTITFTLTLENNAPQQTSLIIPPAPINLDSATAVALLGSINVAFAGFDNTYSASQIAFTFYDITGKALPQGAIDVNATTAFQQYFSTTQAGGTFQVLAHVSRKRKRSGDRIRDGSGRQFPGHHHRATDPCRKLGPRAP